MELDNIPSLDWEEWRDIPWYEWKYKASSLGRIKSFGRKCKHWWLITPSGISYKNIALSKNWKKTCIWLHRIIATTFIKNQENKRTVNHKNGNKQDNRVENLEWCTQWENIKHSYDIWLRKVTKNFYFYTNPPFKWILWEKHPKAIKIVQYDMNRKKIQEWGSIIDAANSLWLHRTNLVKSCKRKLKSSWWFIWRYKDDDDLSE